MTTPTTMDALSRAGVFPSLAIHLVPTLWVESTGERGNESSDQ